MCQHSHIWCNDLKTPLNIILTIGVPIILAVLDLPSEPPLENLNKPGCDVKVQLLKRHTYIEYWGPAAIQQITNQPPHIITVTDPKSLL